MFGSAGDEGGVFAVDTISTNSGTAWTDGEYLLATHTAAGSGVGATFTVTIASGVATIAITSAGDGYSINDTVTVANSVLGGNAGGNDLTFDVSDTTTSNQLSNGLSITWTDKNDNHTAGDKYEFSAELSNRSKVYYINNPPSGWTYASTYLGGVIPKEIDVHNPESWTNDALFHEDTLKKFWSMMNLGLTDAYRAINGDKVEYTFFDYKRVTNFINNKGLRIDHFLLPPSMIDKLDKCYIDSKLRGLEKPSDHVPIVCEFKL